MMARSGGHFLDTMPPVLVVRPDGIEPSHADSKSGHADRQARYGQGRECRKWYQNPPFPDWRSDRSAWLLNKTPATTWTRSQGRS